MMKFTLSEFTEEDGVRAYTVLVGGMPVMATTKDRARAVNVFQQAVKNARHVGKVVCSTWNGDTGEDTIVEPADVV